MYHMISRKTFIACNSVYFAKRNCNTAGQQSNSKVITLLDVASWWWWVGWLERRNGVLCKITVNDYFTPRSGSNAKKKGTEWDVCCSASLQMECLLVFHVRVKFRGCRPPTPSTNKRLLGPYIPWIASSSRSLWQTNERTMMKTIEIVLLRVHLGAERNCGWVRASALRETTFKFA